MSSSIDHVLYNKLNLTEEEKEVLANNFIKQYKNKWNDCISYFVNSSFTVNKDYKTSWEFIMNDNSLKRYSNLHLCFPQNVIELITPNKTQIKN